MDEGDQAHSRKSWIYLKYISSIPPTLLRGLMNGILQGRLDAIQVQKPFREKITILQQLRLTASLYTRNKDGGPKHMRDGRIA